MGEWIVRLWISKAPKCFLELEKCLTMKIYISAIITMFGNKVIVELKRKLQEIYEK